MNMSPIGRWLLCASLLCVSLAWVAVACSDEEEGGSESEGEGAPLLGVLELPVSLRTGDTAPADAIEVEMSPSELRVNGQPIGALSGPGLPADARAKLAQAVSQGGKKRAALSLHASAPYGATSAVLEALSKAGVSDVAFKVRKPSGTEVGWIALSDIGVSAPSAEDADVSVPGAAAMTWGDFEGAWEAVYEACRGSDSGNCAYKPEKVAEGGNLKLVLFAAGQGVNVNFYRTGAPPPEVPEPAPTTDKPTDPMDEVENAAPATEALFQFRDKEAVKSPSAVTATVAPVCEGQACGVVVRGEPGTGMLKLLSLLGAAFPDGAPAPRVVFELSATAGGQ